MSKTIITYALIKALYDQGQDYIDAFWPFAIKVMPDDAPADIVSIQGLLRTHFDLSIPIHVLNTILNRAKKKGYLDKKRGAYTLTEAGRSFSANQDTDKETERKLNYLIDNINIFFINSGNPLSKDQFYDLLIDFLKRNIEILLECINPKADFSNFIIKNADTNDNLLVDFIKMSDRQNPDCYRIIKELIFGSLISTVIFAQDASSLSEIQNKKFKHCKVYLDTNYIFSILGYHYKNAMDPAKELLDLLKKIGFELKVFSFTVDEICRVLSNYPDKYTYYPSNLRIDGIYGALKEAGKKPSDIKEIIINIDSILENMGIKIEWANDIDLETYEPEDPGLRDKIEKYKPGKKKKSINHDLAVIEKIRAIRGSKFRKIEDSKALFLTSDMKLAKFDFMEMGHYNNQTVCEVILDRLLTNILWLKDPSIELPMKMILAAYSKDLFIKKEIWEKFYENVRLLKIDQKISDEQISSLFYHNYVENELRKYKESDVDKITPQFVLAKIEEYSRLSDQEIARKMSQKEMEIREQARLEIELAVKSALIKNNQEKETEWTDRISKIRMTKRNESIKMADKIWNYGRFAASTMMATFTIILYLKYGWEIIDKAGNVFTILTVIGVSSIMGSFVPKVKNRFVNFISNRLYFRAVRDIELFNKISEP